MDKAYIEKEINKYMKEVSLEILKDYKKSLGDSNIYLLNQIECNVFASFKENTAIVLDIPESITSTEIALSYLKRQIPRKLFSFFIVSEKKKFETLEEEEFCKDLTEGLINRYVDMFCEKHHFMKEKRETKESESIADVLLAMKENGVNKDAMVFQTSYSYMLQIYSISEKKNLLSIYHKNYTSKKKLKQIKPLLEKYFQQENLYAFYSIHNTTSFIKKDLKERIQKKYFGYEQEEVLKEFERFFPVSIDKKENKVSKNGFLKMPVFLIMTFIFGIFLTWIFFLK